LICRNQPTDKRKYVATVDSLDKKVPSSTAQKLLDAIADTGLQVKAKTIERKL
jgi:hypothetical protein